MNATFAVAADLLREAIRRRWFLAFAIVITLFFVFLAAALRMDVVDGTLAASSLFGASLHSDLRAADLALRPLFQAAAYIVYYGGILFGIVSCADFAPSLLSPGRIEHLLSLPVRRWELIVGTFLGVWALSACASIYAAGGLTVILGVKTGVWTIRPLAASLLSSVAWGAIYAAMLSAAVFVRSAAIGAGIGGLVFLGGLLASHRLELMRLFNPGLARVIFGASTAVFPRVSPLGNACARVASSQAVESGDLTSLLAGFVLFAAAAIALAIWRFEQQDY